MATRPIITLTTDFGLNDHYVGAVKGVILGIVPEAQIVDVCHMVHPFDILDGAMTIAQAYTYFPPRTVHVVVVDPGVGTQRRPIIASTERHHFVAPDNGVLSMIFAREERMHVHHVTAEHYFRDKVSKTFHARDIFSPVAAYLAKRVEAAKFGPEISDFVRFNTPKPKPVNGNTLRGVVLKVDRFGNLVTNISAEDAPMLFEPQPPPFKMMVGKREIREVKTLYADGAPGEVFAILGSMGYLEISTNRGSAAQLIGSGKGTEVSLILEGAAATSSGT